MERQLYHYQYVDRPYEAIVDVLENKPSSILEPATDVAVKRADAVAAIVHVEISGFDVGREVELTVGEWQDMTEHVGKLPITWEAAENEALFPAMEGQLEIAAMSAHPPLCQLTFVGHYRPPAGWLGAAADTMFGHRVAEAAIKHFVDHAVEALEEQIPAG